MNVQSCQALRCHNSATASLNILQDVTGLVDPKAETGQRWFQVAAISLCEGHRAATDSPN
jgi:hypothetical protein